MALENNATCSICGKPYRVCRTCEEITSFTPWRTVTDTLPHYMIYLVLFEYTKNKDKAKAKEELEKCDLSELETFDNDIKNVINEILGKNDVVEETKKVSTKQTINKK